MSDFDYGAEVRSLLLQVKAQYPDRVFPPVMVVGIIQINATMHLAQQVTELVEVFCEGGPMFQVLAELAGGSQQITAHLRSITTPLEQLAEDSARRLKS